MLLEPNQILDNRYEIIEKLGQGGMGVVWKANDQQLGDEVVIKMPLVNSEQVILQRFAAEAQMMRRHSIGNPNIIDIQGVGDVDETPYYVMRFLPGGSLEDRCPLVTTGAAKEFNVETFEWLVGIGKALDYLHSKGVLHRDVKPANILFNESGDAYLADFGIAKNPTEVTNFTQGPTAPGTSPGTFGYMAPEVLDPDPDSPAAGTADQYALAVTLHETIAGKRPYDASNVIKLYRQTQQGCTPLRESFAEMPEAASQAVVRALSADPRQRFDSCRSFADTFLDGLRNRGATPVTPVAPPQPDPVPEEDGTREFHQAEYREQLEKQKPVGGGGLDIAGSIKGQPQVPVKPTGGSTGPNGRRLIGWMVGGALAVGAVVLGLIFSGLFNGDSNPSTTDQIASSEITTNQPVPVSPSSSADSSPANTPKQEITNSIGMKFRLIAAGEFMMGSPESEADRDDDELQHRVEISGDFYMGKFEVTQGQWKSVMGTEPWKGEDAVKEGVDFAATYVSWEDAVEFCKKLSARDGVDYRLPSEAEWEYACRGGSELAYSFGDAASDLGKYAWFDDNADSIGEDYAHEVGQKRANDFGLHDMHGNAWEWCGDFYGDYDSSETRDPTGASDGTLRVLRGGSWFNSSRSCRSADRLRRSPDLRSSFLGFRVLRSSIK